VGALSEQIRATIHRTRKRRCSCAGGLDSDRNGILPILCLPRGFFAWHDALGAAGIFGDTKPASSVEFGLAMWIAGADARQAL
jgi:hypothetical protein